MEQVIGYRIYGIEPRFAWPKSEQAIDYDGNKFTLVPPTEGVSPLITTKLSENLPLTKSDRQVSELLSHLAWHEQAGVTIRLAAWSSCSTLAIARGAVAYVVGGPLHLPTIAQSATRRLALALYREGLSVNLPAYALLSYFKIINIIRDKGREQKAWIHDNVIHIREKSALARVEVIRHEHADIAGYLYDSCRCAVAHAYDQASIVNPDDPSHLQRLHHDLPVIRDLARCVIEKNLPP